jgi:phosphohistidine phosphatase SixA
MQAFLIRHAESVPETLALRDPHRHLTAHGREQARSLGERLSRLVTPTHVWTSPLVRAVQTAELVRPDLLIEGVPGLAPDGNVRDVITALQAMPDAIVFLVGHEPSLSGIGAILANDPSFVGLAKAEAVHVAGGRVRERLAWSQSQ